MWSLIFNKTCINKNMWPTFTTLNEINKKNNETLNCISVKLCIEKWIN